jgi:predicted transcriptional regulator
VQWEKKTEVQPLSSSEKKIFLALYTEQEPLTFQDISEKCHLTMAKVREKVSILVDKGLPLQRQLSNSVMMFSLNPEFKELQAKENIINLSLESFM